MTDERRLTLGIAAMVVGALILSFGILIAHFTGLATVDEFGQEIYPAIPRGWVWVTLGQVIAMTGAQIGVLGIILAFVYERKMTWARASIGAVVATTQAIIIFGIIPNEWLTLTQATFEWTPQRIAFTIPPWLVLNNDVSISFAAIKDLVSAGYVTTALIGIAIAIVWWQGRDERQQAKAKVTPLSTYGRPIRKGEQ